MDRAALIADAVSRHESRLTTLRPVGIAAPRPVRLPCLYEGAISESCACNDETKHIRFCDHPTADHDRCTRGHRESTLQRCDQCRDYVSPKKTALPSWPDRYKWVSTAQLTQDAVSLASLIPANARAICGIPRSGMLPASVIAVVRHLPLYELTPAGPRKLAHVGSRSGGIADGPGPMVVVDDTVYGGSAMQRARQWMRGQAALYAAVYVRPEATAHVDLVGRILPCPHILQWNILNCGVAWGNAANPAFGRGVAVDFDGVLCHDHESGGPEGEPFMLPRLGAIPLIVTGRPESARAGTEAWLTRHGCKWHRLEMMPGHTLGHWEEIAVHKARHYAASGCGFFIESDSSQAQRIHEITGRPVVCPAENKILARGA